MHFFSLCSRLYWKFNSGQLALTPFQTLAAALTISLVSCIAS